MRFFDRRRGTARGLILGAVGALAVALLPAVALPAAAATPTPFFTYIERGSTAGVRMLGTAAIDGSGAARLTLANYQTYDFAVSTDGNTLLANVVTGPPTSSWYDKTHAVVLVHRQGATTTATVLSTYWDTNSVLSADGRTAYWLVDGKVYRHVETDWVAPGVTTTMSATAFRPASTETVWAFAVSPDGVTGAALYRNSTTGKSGRILAATLATGAVRISATYGLGALQPDGSSFVFVADDVLLHGQSNGTPAPPSDPTITTVTRTLGSTSAATVPALENMYAVRQAEDGTWWMWKDSRATTPATSTAWSTPDPRVTDPVAQPGPRSNGDTTFGYLPSTVAPPSLMDAGAAAGNASAAHPFFTLSASTALYGRKVAYSSFAWYLQPIPGYAYPAYADEVDRGRLERSIDGVHYTTLGTTTGARLFRVGTKWYNAYTPVLARNTWLRWTYLGDFLTRASTPTVRLVRVVPIVTVRVSRIGTRRTVSGVATRKGGTAVLYRVMGRRLVTVAATTLTARGAYSFGRRSLAPGTYKVVVMADRYWAAGAKLVAVR